MTAVAKNIYFDVLNSDLNNINNLNDEEIVRNFYEKELQKTNQEEFRIEKVIKRKGNKLHVEWKFYDNSFNSWKRHCKNRYIKNESLLS